MVVLTTMLRRMLSVENHFSGWMFTSGPLIHIVPGVVVRSTQKSVFGNRMHDDGESTLAPTTNDLINAFPHSRRPVIPVTVTLIHEHYDVRACSLKFQSRVQIFAKYDC